MQANNAPTLPTTGDNLPPPTWEVFWDALKPHPLSVAVALAKQHGAVNWPEALKVTEMAADK